MLLPLPVQHWGQWYWQSESAGALTNENYIYVTAETRRLGAVIPVSTGAIGYINDTIVASATDYK